MSNLYFLNGSESGKLYISETYSTIIYMEMLHHSMLLRDMLSN